MARRIVTRDGGLSYAVEEFELPPLGPLDVRARVVFAAPKHGTEAQVIGGSVQDRKRWDPELRLFLPRPDGPAPAPAERQVGNIVVGVVTAVGERVTRLAVGQRAYAYAGIRDEHQAEERLWRSAEGLSDVDAVCVDPAHVALVAVRDGNVRVGDDVAVFGLGAIGLMAAQIARAGGARRVIAVDPIAARREVALAGGAALALDPGEGDAALAIKLATERAGVDVAVETSGSGRALNDAVRCIRQCGTVVHVPWGPRDASALHLDEEFHLNRPTIVGSQAWDGWGNPDRSHPLWDHARAFAAAEELLRSGKISGAGVVAPVVGFADAAAALPEALRSPEAAIKLGVRFD